jgi:hypothetical protein
VLWALEDSGYNGGYTMEQDVGLTESAAAVRAAAEAVEATVDDVPSLVTDTPAPEAHREENPSPHDAGRKHEEVA